MTIKKSDIKLPALPQEEVDVPALGGEVIVRGMLLGERLEIMSSLQEGRFAHVSRILAATVVDADGKQMFSQEEWETFGATHFNEAMRLAAIASRLSGMDREGAEKN